MTVQDLPRIGDRLYLMHREVVVTKIYTSFQFIKIHYIEEPVEFFVDICALTRFSDTTSSISLGLLRRGHS